MELPEALPELGGLEQQLSGVDPMLAAGVVFVSVVVFGYWGLIGRKYGLNPTNIDEEE